MRRSLLVAGLTASVSCSEGGGPAPSRPTPPTVQFTISGTVSETVPTTSVRIAGATVTVKSTGQSAVTDANGTFQLSAPAGAVTLSARASNYVERTLEITIGDNRSLVIELDPVFQTVTTTTDLSIEGGDACPGWWDGFLPDTPCKADHIVNVHHDGTLAAEITWPHARVDPYIQLYAMEEGQPFSAAIASSEEGSDKTLRAEVKAHTQYLIQVRMFSGGGGPPSDGARSFRLMATRPN